MKNIAKRLNTYITAHSFDPGDSDCETILDRKNASATSPKAFLEGLKYGAHFSTNNSGTPQNNYALTLVLMAAI